MPGRALSMSPHQLASQPVFKYICVFAMTKKAAFGIILLICMLGNVMAEAYTVKGKFGNLSCFYPRVYLSVIHNIGGIYETSSEAIIANAEVDTAGNFILTGNYLPDEPLFYRLYFTHDTQVRSLISGGPMRNYILLSLSNASQVNLFCDNFCKPYFKYTVSNSPENEAILEVQNLLTSSDSLLRKADGESKQQFLAAKRSADLKRFADTSTNLLAALWAVTEMHIDSTFRNEAPFYLSFSNRFRTKGHTPTYAGQLEQKISVLQYVTGNVKSSSGLMVPLLAILLGCSVLLNVLLAWRKRKLLPTDLPPAGESELAISAGDKEEHAKGLIEKLTIKERDILKMVNEGLSNKEIAEKLFVEVSTVKSHVSSIYQKTEIKNRKEVAGIARYLDL
jgi:DNA-binding CsgD family transcriptional regulator